MSDTHDVSRITDGLGSHWKVTENCFKLHSCCGHTHTAVDVALALRDTRGWSVRDALREVRAIRLETYGPGFEIVKARNPVTPYQAKFSLAYCVAAAIAEGRVGLEQFSQDRFAPDGVRHAAIGELMRRTHITVCDDLSAKYPAAWPARVVVELGDGSTASGAADFPRGNPENPVSTGLLEEKFLALTGARYGAEVATRALRAVRAVGSCADVSGAFREFGALPAHPAGIT
jgi:2-methylcitrate dehydratase PrpD